MSLPTDTSAMSDYDAARERGVFALLPPAGAAVQTPGIVAVKGAGAGAFLQSQVTSDVLALGMGEGQPSARVSRKGKLEQLFSVHRAQQSEFLLLVDGAMAAELAADLERYLFDESVRIEIPGGLDWLLLQGPLARDLAAPPWQSLQGCALDGLPAGSIRRIGPAGEHPVCLVFAATPSGEPGFLIAAAEADGTSTRLADEMLAAAAAAGMATPAGDCLADLLESLRIEAGLPRLGVDMIPGEQLLPETGLETDRVDYDKGCYIGQETIARIRTYGSTTRALRVLVLSGWEERGDAALLNLPDPRSPLVTAEGVTLGRVGSSCFSPRAGAPVALAFIRRAERKPGTELILQGKRFDFAATVTLARGTVDAATGSPQALYEAAVERFIAREDEDAMALLEEALRIDPSYEDAYEALGVILGRSERFDEAIALFRKLEQIAPDEPMVNTNLSLYYMKLGDKETAEVELAKGTRKRFGRLSSENAEQKRVQAEILDAERKLAMFSEVLEIDASDPLALGGVGSALSALERFAEAEPYLRAACERQPDNATLFLAHGKALERLERMPEARSVYALGIDAASRKGSLMPLAEMERRLRLLDAADR